MNRPTRPRRDRPAHAREHAGLAAEDLLMLFRKRIHHPADLQEVTRLLGIPRERRATARRLLRRLVDEGALVQIRGHRFGLPDHMNLVVGRLEGHSSGYAFVVPERRAEDLAGDIYIAAHNLQDALHGDRVVARVERRRDDGRAEGRIVRVVERRSEIVVGRFEVDAAGMGYVVAFDRRVTTDIHVPRGEGGAAEAGQMVTVAITRWPTPTRGPLGRVVEVLGDIDAPGVDIEIILRKHHIPDGHGPEAIAEAHRLGPAVRERDLIGRTDFRDRIVVTIDGEHARDFDDAISIERKPNGHYWLGVHIADVGHYVREGSALDREAYERATSVYFPERAIHMFPSELATGLCSLNPHVDRLVQSCLMEVSPDGEVIRHQLHDGVIRSAERMTYTEVNAILTGDPEARARHEPLVPTFELMRDLFDVLHVRRQRRGSVDFDLPESEVILDADGLVEDIAAAERNVAHRLIEEFMLLANETVARHLEDAGMPALYRIHERPDSLKVEEFTAFVSSLGFRFDAPPGGVRSADFQRLVQQIRGAPAERPIAFLMLRTMQKARYDAINRGHFGLAAEWYTHFTSPIRRYPDLVVHRLLRELRHTRVTAERREALRESLPEVGRHTSEMERRADEAERELVQWKKVRFMADKVGNAFDGYITGVAPFGLFVELVEHFVEGLVHVSNMADDYYRFHEATHAFSGEHTKKTYRLGDRVRVRVVRVDLDRRMIDLGLEEMRAAGRTAGRRPRIPRPGPRSARHERDRRTDSRPRRRAQRPGRRERAARKKR
jgi:ribonuclease R